MIERMRKEFPQLFTKQNSLRKTPPPKYSCACGHRFTRTQVIKVPGMTFASAVCGVCGKKGERSKEYNVWERLSNGQIGQEDFILEFVRLRETATKEEVELALRKEYGSAQTNALGFLVYYGYLKVDAFQRDMYKRVIYTMTDKNYENRYEKRV